ncbi:putative adhesin [Hahella sp. HN01]|uniref:putative adhesin n=1 Tax=Hahella sp. HN01 TaxID=2847262 RepID=UPI001C1EAE0C|nr:hypothetical protein [Hahella sp. HN01]MBU6954546.1 hypothetical protein [Hahella sp. HN01]
MSIVISGHGTFNEKYLATAGRKKIPTFPIPPGVTLICYAPPGAALDNPLAQKVEVEAVVDISMVELKQRDSSTVKPMPGDEYPFELTEGNEMIDFTVMPPDGLALLGSPVTVTVPTPLRVLVEQHKDEGTIHYACCGTGFSDSPSMRDLFPFRGWYARLKED